jgi:uncharacterized protein YdeI (YjbR/CyaY-like superfamily)
MAAGGQPRFFRTAAEFRRWLQRHGATRSELVVGFYKVGSGRPSMTWPESVDEALCFGWIDGVRRSVDASSYEIRFTPRQPKSIWSTKNIQRAQELIAEGRMRAAGRAAFEARREDLVRRYSFEQADPALGPEHERRFRANRKAWAFFQSQPAYYRRLVTWWIVSAKRAETRERRLDTLIRDSEAGERIAGMRR